MSADFDRIRDPIIAEELAYREDDERDQIEYAWGRMLGHAAMGNPRYEKMVRATVDCAKALGLA